MNESDSYRVSVLLTDDSAVVRERLGALLREESKIEVVGEAASGEEAWRMFNLRHPRAVVLDVQLPDASGVEILKRIKTSAPDCVVLMLTNYNDPIYQTECHRYGADHFLSKSTEFERVPQLLSQLADSRAFRNRTDIVQTQST